MMQGNERWGQLRQELRGHHQGLLFLCDTLESIADSLPNNLNEQALLSVSRSIYSLVKRAHDFEELQLFPVIQTVTADRPDLEDSLERLKFEHWEDESYAEEISEHLRSYVTEPAARNTSAMSYMLRGFFEGIRRHIAFEVEHLVPLLNELDHTGTPPTAH